MAKIPKSYLPTFHRLHLWNSRGVWNLNEKGQTYCSSDFVWMQSWNAQCCHSVIDCLFHVLQNFKTRLHWQFSKRSERGFARKCMLKWVRYNAKGQVQWDQAGQLTIYTILSTLQCTKFRSNWIFKRFTLTWSVRTEPSPHNPRNPADGPENRAAGTVGTSAAGPKQEGNDLMHIWVFSDVLNPRP